MTSEQLKWEQEINRRIWGCFPELLPFYVLFPVIPGSLGLTPLFVSLAIRLGLQLLLLAMQFCDCVHVQDQAASMKTETKSLLGRIRGAILLVISLIIQPHLSGKQYIPHNLNWILSPLHSNTVLYILLKRNIMYYIDIRLRTFSPVLTLIFFFYSQPLEGNHSPNTHIQNWYVSQFLETDISMVNLRLIFKSLMASFLKVSIANVFKLLVFPLIPHLSLNYDSFIIQAEYVLSHSF